MKNLEIKINLSITNKGEVLINDTKVVDLNSKITKLTTDFIIKESQAKYGYLHFPKKTGFQEYIKNGRDITLCFKETKYRVNNYKEAAGRVNGLGVFFKDNALKKDDKLRIELFTNTEPLKMYIKKL